MAKVKFTQMKVRVERAVQTQNGSEYQTFCPLLNGLPENLKKQKILPDADLLPRTNQKTKREDPIIVYGHDPSLQWAAAGTWIYLSTCLKNGWRVIAVESGQQLSLPGDLHKDY